MAVTGFQVRSYMDNVHHRAQESESKVMGTTVEKTAAGRSIGFPIMDPAEMEELTSRYQPTGNNTPSRFMRHVFPRSAVLNLLEDLLDADEHFWEVGSEHVKVGAAASNRLMIIRLRTAALGNAFETDEDDIENGGGTSIALPAAQTIVHNTAALTKAKVVSARTKLDQSVGGDRAMWGPYYLMYDPIDFNSLSLEADFNTLDSVTRQALMQGMIVQGLMGFTWIPTATLPTVAGTGIRTNVAWARSAMGKGMNRGAMIRAGERADRNYMTQIWRREKYNYVRIDDKGVVGIEVDTAQIPA